MIQFLSKMRNNKKGFTLVELMVVIAIIGILVAIAVPVYNNVTTNAENRANQATARTILSAVSMASAANETGTPTEAEINSYLNEDIIVAAAATNANKWAVNKTGGVWEVYHWNGTSSAKITFS